MRDHPVTVRHVEECDLRDVLELLSVAFDDDPWFNFVATQDGRRQERLRRWLDRGLRRKTFPLGETYMTTDASGAALWIPPHVTSDGLRGTFELWLSLIRTCGWTRAGQVADAIRRIVACEPSAPHVELRLLAVRTDRRGEGVASALLRPMLDRCDQTHTSIALLCTKRANVPLYEHFGFHVTHLIQIPEGPTLWQMVRHPES